MPTLKSGLNAQANLDLLGFTQGIDLDKPLAVCEVQVQEAWAKGLCAAGYLQAAERDQLLQVLSEARELFVADQFPWKVEDEDVHMNLERFMSERLGALGKRIHLGRSRNDLIATTLRLFVSEQCRVVSDQVGQLIGSLVAQAETNIEVIVPGLTHLQFGQPIRMAQVFLSHAWGFKRDLARLKFCADQAMESMPLGSAALGGTHIAIDLPAIAEELGFSNPSFNSYDSVGDRDFVQLSLQCFSSIAIHMSRLAEDVIIWSSQPYRWLALPPEWSTGSSIMPNKRNPDVAEIVRAKSAQVIGAEQSGQLLLKGLVSSYSSDLHELKRVYLGSLNQIQACLSVFPPFVAGLQVNQESVAKHLNSGHILATEIANQLTEKGTPFREAYAEVAQLVDRAEKDGKQIHQCGEFELSFEKAVEQRSNCGGTARAQILEQIQKLKI
ncbi:MAG: argininosuccinate lyase [Bdellovibrionales bacterium]|nr:argininosuccinate lyase [Bdellovibrionales bacterium]